jgi:hypothetical protein
LVLQTLAKGESVLWRIFSIGIKWTVSGKVKKEVERTAGSSKKNLKFDHDASGNRIAKHVYDSNWNWLFSDFYVRYAQGNVMSIYRKETVIDPVTQQPMLSFKQIEKHIYGSSRIGIEKTKTEMIGATAPSTTNFSHTLGNKFFEGTNHLGNVLVVFTDRKIPVDADNDNTEDYYLPDVTSANDYYPFGFPIPERSFSSSTYRYGFNTQEKVEELGDGHYTAEFWEYDGDLGVRENLDPDFKSIPGRSPYEINFDNPILFQDPTGAQTEKAEKEIKLEDLPKAANVGEFLAKATEVIEPGQKITSETLKEFINPNPEKEGEKQVAEFLEKIESLEAIEGKKGQLQLEVRFKAGTENAQKTFRFGETDITVKIKKGTKLVVQKLDAQKVSLKVEWGEIGTFVGIGKFGKTVLIGSENGKITINKDKLETITIIGIFNIEKNQPLVLPEQFKKK